MTRVLTYAEREQRKRTIVAWVLTVVFYAALFGTALLLRYLLPDSFEISNRPLIVNLVEVPQTNAGRGSPVEVRTPEPSVEKPAPPPAAAPATKKATPAPATPPVPAATPQPSAPAQPATPRAAVEEPPAPYVPGPRAPGSRVSSSESSVALPGVGQVPWGTGSAVTIRKSEKGNSVETMLGGSSDMVGQSLYVPVYLGMPLPESLPRSIFEAIPDEIIPPSTVVTSAAARKKAFLMYYEQAGDLMRRKADIPLEVREKLWEMLEDAGYDITQADYKAGRNLNPVVIGFSVTRDRQLRGVEILQSSGDPVIDEAVLYGFRRSTFWNKSGENIQGRFVYRF